MWTGFWNNSDSNLDKKRPGRACNWGHNTVHNLRPDRTTGATTSDLRFENTPAGEAAALLTKMKGYISKPFALARG